MTPEQIIATTSAFFSVDRAAIVDRSRRAPVVRARHVAIWLIRTELGLSFSAIGTIVNRDHSTVQYAVSRVNCLVEHDELAATVRRLQHLIRRA